jgi:predicted alpha/beta-fold hydrolase
MIEPFRPRFPWIGADLQTLAARFGTQPFWSSEALEFEMPDGDVLFGHLDRAADGGKPLAVLLHGLVGSAQSLYMRSAALALRKQGYGVLRLDWRGAGAGEGRSKAIYHAGRSADLAAVLERIPADLVRQGIVAAAFSLGANILLKYLGEAGQASKIARAVSVSAPIDLAATSLRIHAPRNRLYHDYLLRRMKRSSPHSQARDPAIATIRAFDERIVARLNGFADADDYYARSAARFFMPAIAVPAMLVHAMDDPWIPGSIYRDYPWAENPNLTPLLTQGGGHVGFHDAGHALARHERALLDFFAR